ncbi:DNA-binding MarR family transcriptional regulator [Herbiconiux flava]|uniref:DNA-binding MarR family transcriptional regulator n=2 Tax=Herbiconiux flava TaxID=881268 RepID=A0A852SP71_9MICO|nr:DNA-binding MarR family transcriptional regulator [Herbiconiux flava]
MQTMKERQLRPIGMTASHYALLVSIDSEPGSAGATLARRLNVTPQAVAALVARLEDRGLLERRSHPRHAHVQELHLTEPGRQALRQAEEVMERIEQQVIELIGPDSSSAFRVALDTLADSALELPQAETLADR